MLVMKKSTGTLYYTDSHYGEDKIPKEMLLKKMCFHFFDEFKAKLEISESLKENLDSVTDILKLLLSSSSDMTIFQKLEELVKTIEELLKVIPDNPQSMNCFELLDLLVGIIVPKFQSGLCKEQAKHYKILQVEMKDIDYFKLFQEVTGKKRDTNITCRKNTCVRNLSKNYRTS